MNALKPYYYFLSSANVRCTVAFADWPARLRGDFDIQALTEPALRGIFRVLSGYGSKRGRLLADDVGAPFRLNESLDY